MTEAARAHLNKTHGGLQILVKARVKDSAEISKAVETIKSLRRKCKDWDSAREVRKWRRR